MAFLVFYCNMNIVALWLMHHRIAFQLSNEVCIRSSLLMLMADSGLDMENQLVALVLWYVNTSWVGIDDVSCWLWPWLVKVFSR